MYLVFNCLTIIFVVDRNFSVYIWPNFQGTKISHLIRQDCHVCMSNVYGYIKHYIIFDGVYNVSCFCKC